ncbi:amidohydrolase family protein, partial [Rhodobaculum claviforme]
AVRVAARAGPGVAGALRRATAVPARFLGLSGHGRLRVGARADLVHLSDALEVRRVWRAADWSG